VALRVAGWRWTLPVIVVAALALIAGILVSTGSSHQHPGAGPPRPISPLVAATDGGYVALGDSYSSGEGTWDLSTDRAYVNGGAPDCHRSAKSYFQTVADDHRFARGAVLWACSGATVGNLLTEGERGEPPQLDRIGPSTSLVTLSIGGNDIGFTDIARHCILKFPWSSACRDQNATVRAKIGRLATELPALFQRITARAPYARIITLGYPRMFPTQPTHSVDLIGPADQRWLNDMVADLDGVIATAAHTADRHLVAARRPGSVEFVDTYTGYDGHELGTAQPYLNALDLDFADLTVEPRSLHPNALGYQRFAQLVNRQILIGPARPIYHAH
jgi:lysophospholipase L1-like esterase